MKLIRLSCDQSCFRTIDFNPSGLTLILGSKSDDLDNSSSVNGVGKTQALRLVNFCLGAKKTNSITKTLSYAFPKWIFRLDFSIKNEHYFIERSGDSSILRLNNEEISHKALLDWLNHSHIFPRIDDKKFLSFRSLLPRFARTNREDSLDCIKFYKETEYTTLINTAYLFNLELDSIQKKKEVKDKLIANKKERKSNINSTYISEVLKTNLTPKNVKDNLEKEIEQLERSLENFSVAENYHDIQREADSLTEKLSDLKRKSSALEFKTNSIKSSMEQKPDINNEQLLSLYQGLEHIFRKEILDHFENVQKFHNELTVNRMSRLQKEMIEIENQIQELNNAIIEVSKERDGKLIFLKENHALDEFMALNKQLASKQQKLSLINDYLEHDHKITKESLELKQQMLDIIKNAIDYVETEPLKTFNNGFQNITSKIYNKLKSGIYMEADESDNSQTMYKFMIELETDNSDGVSAIKMLAFDWTIFQYGYHNMNWLWHDNRIFADIDPEELAKWFKITVDDLTNSDKQYIASININNYDDMKNFMDESHAKILDESIVLTLQSDNIENKLMGANFDKPRASS